MHATEIDVNELKTVKIIKNNNILGQVRSKQRKSDTMASNDAMTSEPGLGFGTRKVINKITVHSLPNWIKHYRKGA